MNLWPDPKTLVSNSQPSVGNKLWPEPAKVLGVSVKAPPVQAEPQPAPPTLPAPQNPFNPKTPGHDEYLRQINTPERSPSTSVFKQFLSSLLPATKEVGSLVAGKKSLPYTVGKSVVEQYTKPTDMTKQAEAGVPNVPGLKQISQAILRTLIPIGESTVGPIIGEGIFGQNEQSKALANNKTVFTVAVPNSEDLNKKIGMAKDLEDKSKKITNLKTELDNSTPTTKSPRLEINLYNKKVDEYNFALQDFNANLKNYQSYTVRKTPQVQSNVPDTLVTHKLTAEDVVSVALSSIGTGFLIAPLVTKYATSGALRLSEAFAKESKVPLSFSDLQSITTSTSDAEAISRVGQEKYNAYREAVNKDTVRQAIKDGYVRLAEKDPTTFSNILKNAATRPIQEITNFGKTYGPRIKVPTTKLLPEKTGSTATELWPKPDEVINKPPVSMTNDIPPVKVNTLEKVGGSTETTKTTIKLTKKQQEAEIQKQYEDRKKLMEERPKLEPADFSDKSIFVKKGDFVVDEDGNLLEVTSGNDKYQGNQYVDEINKDYIRAKPAGTDFPDFLDYANRIRVATPDEVSKIVPVQVSDQIPADVEQVAQTDWENNYSQKAGELFDQSTKLDQQIKQAKGAEKKALIAEKAKVDQEAAALEDAFLNKHQDRPEGKTQKRIGLMDYHESYTPHMRELIKEAQDKNELFPYLKMTSEEQQIVDNALKNAISKMPMKHPEEAQAYEAGTKLAEERIANKEAVILDPDELKQVTGNNNTQNHPIYSKAVVQLYKELLPKVENPIVKFTAGGPGSGKTDFLTSVIKQDFDGIIVDGTLAKFDHFLARLEEAGQYNKQVEINLILPDIKSAWRYVKVREVKTGRSISLEGFLERHLGSIDTTIQVLRNKDLSGKVVVRLKDTRKIFTIEEAKSAEFIDDHGKILDILENLGYDKDVLKEQLYGESRTNQKSGSDTSAMEAGGIGNGNETPERNIQTTRERGQNGKLPRSSRSNKEVKSLLPKASQRPGGGFGNDLTLKPSIAKNPDEEAVKVGAVSLNKRPPIGKIELKTILANNPEFKANPVLVVNADKNLEFVGKNNRFEVKPEAMQLNPENLKVGDRITVDEKALKKAGAGIHQTRIYKGDQAYGFNPKNLDDLESPAAAKETDKIIKRSEIAKTLSEKLNVPIRRGKFNMAGAIGVFKPGPKVVRIKKGGLATVFHEVGHFLDDQFSLSSVIDPKERKALMEEYGFSYDNQPEKQRKEAFAEFLRYSMTGQAERAKTLAPKFSEVFEKRMAELPEVKQVLDTAAADYTRWQQQPATAKVLSHISLEPEGKGSMADRLGNNIHNLYTAALDDLHPLAEFVNLDKNILGILPAEKNPYILARNLRGWIGKADTFLTKGTFGKDYWTEKDGKIIPNFKGKSFAEIMKPIERAGKLDDFRVFLVSKRALELSKRGITSGITTKDAGAALDELSSKHPEFDTASRELYKYQDDLLQFAADNGLVGPEGLTKIKSLNQFRVPFYRVMEGIRSSYMGGKKVAGNIPNPIKKIKGSEREIIDPLESIIKDTYAIINAAERNNIGVAMANLSTQNFELGRLFEKVAKPMMPVKVNVKEVLQKVLPEDLMDIVPEELDEVVSLFRPTYATGPNMLNVNMGDRQFVYQVEPDLFKAIQGLNLEDSSVIMRIMALPSKLLRAGATLTPDFSLRNPLRDQFSAFVYSKYGFRPGIDLVRGLFEVFKKGDVYDLWKMGGGEHSMLVSLDREYLKQNFTDLMKSKKAEALGYIKHPIKLLQVISELGEEATRLGEMKRALDAHANPIEGAFASREVTLDFARIGAKTKAVNQLIAFWNANVQGTDKMIRAFKERPFRTLFKTLMGITLPSVLLYYVNRDDKRWKEIPQWQKDLFWIVMTKKHIYRIPKPFELGIIFGSIPERTLEWLDTKDSQIFGELRQAVANGATPGFIPTGLLPIIEYISNYSFFKDQPIVPEGKQALPPEGQTATYTSETAKMIGENLGLSPAKIDNTISGYTGGLGNYAIQVIDKTLAGTGIRKTANKPTGSLEDMPVIKAFMIRPPVGTSSESVSRVYKLYGDLAGQIQYVKKLALAGEKEKAMAYVKAHPQLAYSQLISKVVSSYTDINRARDQIKNSNLSPEQKRDKIRLLDEAQTTIAQKILEQIK